LIRKLFESETRYLWSRLARAADGDESLAPLYSPNGDPRVTRLVQAAAYVFARVKEKVEDDIPEIGHALVGSALPEVLRGIPSATIVQLSDAHGARRNVLEHGTQRLESRPVDGIACIFETSWPVTTSPLHLDDARVRTLEPGAKTLTLRLRASSAVSLSKSIPEAVRVFVRASDPLRALDVIQGLQTTKRPPRIQTFSASGVRIATRELPPGCIRWTAVEEAFRLFPGTPDRFSSSTALRAFFAFPEVFGFFDVRGIAEALQGHREDVRAVELTLPLDGAVDASSEVTFHLDCAPAVNVFEAAAEAVEVHQLGPVGSLVVAERPDAEVFEVQGVYLVPAQRPDDRNEVHLWERGGPDAAFDDELFVRVMRRASVDRGPTDLRLTLLRPDGGAVVPRGVLGASLLVSDGYRASELRRGDVTRAHDSMQCANFTRVSPAYPPVLDERLPWRVNAYARMPLMHLATASSLAAFVDLHDLRPNRRTVPKDATPASAGFSAVHRRPVYRVEGEDVIHGDAVDLVLNEAAFGGMGATWLIGELLARALAERTDVLRYTHTRWVTTDGAVRADYGARPGERVPPPFG
jgi:type VI secretion system protein ImpG